MNYWVKGSKCACLVDGEGYAGGGAALPVVLRLGHGHYLLVAPLEGAAQGQADGLLVQSGTPLHSCKVPCLCT